MATVNLAHVITAVEFVVAEMAELSDEQALPRHDEFNTARASPTHWPKPWTARPHRALSDQARLGCRNLVLGPEAVVARGNAVASAARWCVIWPVSSSGSPPGRPSCSVAGRQWAPSTPPAKRWSSPPHPTSSPASHRREVPKGGKRTSFILNRGQMPQQCCKWSQSGSKVTTTTIHTAGSRTRSPREFIRCRPQPAQCLV
jgi:hypothetical protein